MLQRVDNQKSRWWKPSGLFAPTFNSNEKIDFVKLGKNYLRATLKIAGTSFFEKKRSKKSQRR